MKYFGVLLLLSFALTAWATYISTSNDNAYGYGVYGGVVRFKPSYATSQPVSATTKPVYVTFQPVYEASKPVYEISKPVYEASKPVYEASKPVYETSKPVYIVAVQAAPSVSYKPYYGRGSAYANGNRPYKKPEYVYRPYYGYNPYYGYGSNYGYGSDYVYGNNPYYYGNYKHGLGYGLNTK